MHCNVESVWNTWDTQEHSLAPIDWNVIPEERYYGVDIEPEPPLRRLIYPLTTQPGWRVTIVPYNPEWPKQFLEIRSHIANLLATSQPPAQFTNIEHIGSTSIPNLCAKPIIDVVVTFPSQHEVNRALEAFAWEVPTSPPFIRYTRIQNGGGIPGRESMKLYIPEHSPYHATTPVRSVYLINESEENLAGRLQVRAHRDLKTTLCDPNNKDLLEEYASVKMGLATQTFEDALTYVGSKDGIIRKILLRAGWTDIELDEKDRCSARISDDVEDPY